jgi:hypothetical protein
MTSNKFEFVLQRFNLRTHTWESLREKGITEDLLAYFMSASSNTPVAGTTSFWESKDFDTGRQ